MEINPFSLIVSSSFWLCSYLVFKSKKEFLGKNYYFLLWVSAGIWWLFAAFPSLPYQFYICGVFFGFQVCFGLLYFLKQFNFSKNFSKVIFFFVSILFLWYLTLLAGAKIELLPAPTGTQMRIFLLPGFSSGYLFILITILTFVLTSVLIGKWIKEKYISWTNLSPLYAIFAPLVYAILVIPNGLLLFQGYFYFFLYFFIPFLVFLAYGKKEKF